MKKQSIIRVGFDLDGVLLYNPARIVRPIMVFIKKYILKRNINKFYYPKNKLEKAFWFFLHRSSLFPAKGIDQLQKLIKENRIEAYIISARYESLKNDFNQWVKKIDPNKKFRKYYFNSRNDQPDAFKEQMIKKLALDFFVEDNWDIVQRLNSNTKKTKIIWIYNILDRKIIYKYKFPSLEQVIVFFKNKI